MTAPAPAPARNAANVWIGAPDKSSPTVGEIMRAPLGTALPTTVGEALAGGFTPSGYISEDGLTFTPELSFSDIKDWGGDTVRRILDSFSGTFSWAFLETGETSQRAYWGDDNVTVTPAVAGEGGHGVRMTIKVNNAGANRESWTFHIKDGDRRMRIVVPDGEINEREPLSFTKSGALVYGVTLATYPDANGNNAYIYLEGEQPIALAA